MAVDDIFNILAQKSILFGETVIINLSGSLNDPQYIDNTGKTLDFAVDKPEKYRA